ncbi:MAG: leucine-rich repeat domain-containing protein [Ruminococcaceae bacterium]|nr:leucine-rich repeat domain-containing protein [Oscillospiraceae bacterium]
MSEILTYIFNSVKITYTYCGGKKMKKVLSLSLIVLMLMPLMVGFELSAASGKCGDNLTWSLSGGTLTISGSGAMTNYNYFEKAPWYDSRNDIKNVVIKDGVTTLGNYAFYECSAITSIEFPSSGLVSIGDEAIRDCTSLKELTLPEGLQTIGLIAIAYNPNLESVYIPDSVTRIRNMAFAQCTSLKEIDYPASATEVESYIFSGCTALERVTLPIGIGKIGLGAFEVCEKLSSINIPDTVTYIRSSAFAYCKSLRSITLPQSINNMENDVFGNCPYLTVECYEGSYAHNYCISNAVAYTFLAAHEHSYKVSMSKMVTCTENGIITYECECGDSYTEVIEAIGHSWLNWVVTKEPTTTTVGVETRECRRGCGTTETREIPMLEAAEPELSVYNYDVTITMAEDISYIRYAKGEYTTASQIKNAPDCVTLNVSKIASYTKDGICTIAMPEGGIYSIWVKLNDGTEYIYKADLSVMDQEIEADGVTMTVKNLYGVKDYFIAKGSHTTYADVKANSVVQITKNKIGSKHDYTYILSEPGIYTVCVRYDDSTRAHKFITVELTVAEPTFTENGLQLIVGNLEGIKVIRTAYGEYKTPGDIKRAEGSRAFTGKTVLKGLEEYAVQYRDEGIVTVAVVYNNGYEVMYNYNVTKKSPTMTQEGRTVTFGNLDDFKVIRYAVGVYTTSNQIKNAMGSVTVSAKNMTEVSYSVTLTPGTYTFCVQYNDESYNYYTVTVE